MSENFPFDTADEFLNAFETRKPAMPDNQIVEADATIHVPAMPDRTPVQTSARAAQLAILGLAVYTQDPWVLIAAVAGATIIEGLRIWSDTALRGYRNARIAEENVAAMRAAAEIKSTAIANQNPE